MVAGVPIWRLCQAGFAWPKLSAITEASWSQYQSWVALLTDSGRRLGAITQRAVIINRQPRGSDRPANLACDGSSGG